MKKYYTFLAIIILVAASALILYNVNAKKEDKGSSKCATIQGGTLTTPDGELIEQGYSKWGYNYQAHLFNGEYCNYHPVYRPEGANYEWCQANYGDIKLVMKWNDAWLANNDCDGNNLLDRHYGYPSYIGSGAWTTNHMLGSYEQDGQVCEWDYFVKIIAAPSDAHKDGGEVWYTANGVEIGPVIWGAFAIIQEVSNDPCAGEEGIQYLSPAAPGFGKYK